MNHTANLNVAYEVEKEAFLISTDPHKLDFDVIHHYLCDQSYWSAGIPMEIVQRAAQGSVCFGVYHHEAQIGYARLITDAATFGYLADVFILESYQGQGLGKWLIETVMKHPACQGFRRWVLATRDAHSLYEKFGFGPLSRPDIYMEKVLFQKYV